MTQHRNGVSMEAVITKLASNGTDFCIPDSIHKCQTMCRSAKQSIRQVEKNSIFLRQENLERQALAYTQQGDKANAKRIRMT
jgi:hypothetical protein